MRHIYQILISRVAAALGIVTLGAQAASDSQVTPAAQATGYSVVHQFKKKEGAALYGTLLKDRSGNLYGTAYKGGANNAGTLFKLIPSIDSAKPLHDFTTTDGIASATGLTWGSDGSLYGLAGGGGQFGGGTAFKLDSAGKFTLLHAFGGPTNDGAYPYLGALARAADGNFYGATMQGGAGQQGVAFQMTPAGDVTVLHAFAGGLDDGAIPRGQLTLGADGKLYGTTVCGGVPVQSDGCGGTLFSLSTRGDFAIIHRFESTDAPQAAPTQVGAFLYGTTSAGGTGQAGTVYRVGLDGSGFTTLHSFEPGTPAARGTDGGTPLGKLLLASDGNLYGTTRLGGTNTTIDPNGDGTVFQITPSGAYTQLQSLGDGSADGARPYSGLVQGADGNLYGTAQSGTAGSDGVIFKIALPTR